MIKEQYQYVNSLSDEVKESLTWYTDATTGNYRELNGYLRNQKTATPEVMEKYELIEGAFRDVPRLKDPLVVYRGMKREHFDTYAYTSTSLDILEAYKFTNQFSKCCILRISVQPGSKILPLESLSYMDYEKEILLYRKGEYMVTSTESVRLRVDGLDEVMKMVNITYLPSDSVEVEDIQDIKKFEKEERKSMIEDNIEGIYSAIFESIQFDVENFGEEYRDFENREKFDEKFDQVYNEIKKLNRDLIEDTPKLRRTIFDKYTESKKYRMRTSKKDIKRYKK